jgi:hypothetical protein
MFAWHGTRDHLLNFFVASVVVFQEAVVDVSDECFRNPIAQADQDTISHKPLATVEVDFFGDSGLVGGEGCEGRDAVVLVEKGDGSRGWDEVARDFEAKE